MLFRRLVLPATLAAALAFPAFSQDGVQEQFNRGVALLKQGKDAEALAAFQAVLAADPSHEAAYELWKATDHQIWLELLAKQGQFELAARRLMTLAEAGRAQRRDDAAAIGALLKDVGNEDVAVRRPALAKLAAEHGEYAVPHMLGALSADSNDDRAVLYINALAQMGEDVVQPLIAALESDNASLRRNVALALGYAGDRRAAPLLSWLAANDAAGGVQGAAREGLARMGGAVDPVAGLVALGDAYHDGSALKPYATTGSVWNWRGGKLVHAQVPVALHGDELAKQCYYKALAISGGDVRALAGLARALSAQHARLDALAARGEDVSAFKPQVDMALGALQALGPAALDSALGASLAQGDEAAAVQLIRALGRAGAGAAPSLQTALQSQNGGLRSHAALAIAHSTLSSRSALVEGTVPALGEAASRQVMRIAVLVDGNEARAAALGGLLAKRGVHVASFNSGAMALAGARRMPGVDVVLLANELPDMTSAQVLDELRESHQAPVLLLSADENAGAAFGDRIAGVVSKDDDLSKLDAAFAGSMNRDREEAQQLALASCQALAELAARGQVLGPAAADLVDALNGRTDDVTVAALAALGNGGGL
ncbi:MAG: response regulator, partial [Planctomycetota bacterium]